MKEPEPLVTCIVKIKTYKDNINDNPKTVFSEILVQVQKGGWGQVGGVDGVDGVGGGGGIFGDFKLTWQHTF